MKYRPSKKSLRSLWGCIVLTIGIFGFYQMANSADYSMETLQARLGEVQDESGVSAVCKDFAEHAESIDVVRSAQDAWKEADADAALEFFTTKHQQNPNSAKFSYLLGRIAKTPLEKIKLGREAAKLDPKWPYGYRLITATYSEALFSAPEDDPNAKILKAELANDGGYFKTFAELETKDMNSMNFLLQYQMFIADYDGAQKTLDKGDALFPKWATPTKRADVLSGKHQYQDALALLTKWVDSAVESGNIAKADRDRWIRTYAYSSLLSVRQYDELIKRVNAMPSATRESDDYYFLASAFALQKATEEAFKALDEAVKAGFSQPNDAERDDNLANLRNDARWSSLIERMQANWVADAGKRKAAILANRLDKPAPNWTLKDVNGKEVKLADLRGQVVILDFWATWCGPCRMSMPHISKFVSERKPKGVRVFSVNVWDNGGKTAKKFMEDNKYSMELLYGDEQTPKDYGISGIPYICAIDKNGVIRYEEKGFSETLPEALDAWAEELGK